MQQIELNEARMDLAKLINAAIGGQEIIITENNQPLLKLVRIAPPKTKRPLGSAKGQIWIAPDFNESYEEWVEEWEKDSSASQGPVRSTDSSSSYGRANSSCQY